MKRTNWILAVMMLVGSFSAYANVFDANSAATLVTAVNSANSTAGSHTIILAAGTYVLTGELPVIATNKTIVFQGATANPADTVLRQTAAGTRILETFFDSSPIPNNVVLTFNNLTFANGQGGNSGGGAILVGGIGSATTVNNCVFTNNTTSTVGTGLAGGAICNSPDGFVTVVGCRFAGNSAVLFGGAIDFLHQADSGSAGGLVVSNSVFVNNSSVSDGGAIKADTASGTMTIVNCNFENNRTTKADPNGGRGGAISHVSGSLTVHDNRFFNNTAATHSNGDTIHQAGGTGSIDAVRNWWGANTGPAANDLRQDGVIPTSPWLQLRLAAGATSLLTGGSTTLTADLQGLSTGGTEPSASLLGLPAVPSSPATIFKNPILGTLSSPSTQFVSGTATATFVAGSTPGTGHADTTLDNATLTASITIIGQPTANNQSLSTSQNTAVSVTLTGSDPNTPPRALTDIVTANPTHGTLSGTAPNLTYTPTAGYFGSDSFQFKVNNGVADSGVATVSITVVGKPTANAQSVTTSQNTAVSVTLTGSDPNTPPRSLTYIVTSNPAHGTLSGTASNLTYTPNAGYFGSDSFQFKVNNGTADSGVATVSITVVGKPTANSQSVTASQNTAVSVTLTGSDPNTPQRALTGIVTANPAHGTLSGTAPNLTYTPNAGYFGPDSFQFKVNNGVSDSSVATVSITIIGQPTANSQSVSTPQNTAASVTLTGSDPNTPPRSLTYIVTSNPAHGTLSGTAPNLTYTPNAGYFGSDSFQFKVNNGVVDSGVATVSIMVVGAPTANAQSVTTSQNTAVSVTLTGSDPNTPPHALTFIVTSNPTHGTLSGTAPNLTYTPNAGYVGPDSFQFKVNNGALDSAVATVSVIVQGAAPVITQQPQSANACPDSTASFTSTATSSPTPTVQWFLSTDGGAQFNEVNSATATTLSFTAAAAQNGNLYRAVFTSGSLSTTSSVATLTVNVPPLAGQDLLGTVEDSAVSAPIAKLLANDSSPINGPLSITAVSAASTEGGTVALNGNFVVYTPKTNFTGSDSFTYTLSDSRCTAQGTVVVTVNSTNALTHNLITIEHTTSPPPVANLLTFAGIPGQAYVIQWAPAPSGPWTDLSPSLLADPTGLVTYTDTNPPSPRFYRTRW